MLVLAVQLGSLEPQPFPLDETWNTRSILVEPGGYAVFRAAIKDKVQTESSRPLWLLAYVQNDASLAST